RGTATPCQIPPRGISSGCHSPEREEQASMSHDSSTHVHGDHAPTHEEHADHSGHGGHGEHGGHGDHVAQFRRLFWIMLVLAIPVVALSPMFAHLLGYSVPESGGVSWIPPMLGTVLYVRRSAERR